MEMSHRSKDMVGIAEQAEADLRELLGVRDDYAVLFLQGGATAQFAAVPLNLLGDGRQGRLRQHRAVVDQGDRRGAEVLQGQRGGELAKPRASPACRRSPSGSAPRLPPTCTTRRTRPSAASSTAGCPRWARRRWSPTCPRHPVAPDRRQPVRRDLRRRAEEHRSRGAGAGDRAPRAARARPTRARRPCSTGRCRPRTPRCTTRRRPIPATSPGWCSSG